MDMLEENSLFGSSKMALAILEKSFYSEMVLV